jgi:hypothetical protein
MDSRREHIFVLLSVFIVMKYVIVDILALQKLAIFQQNVQMMMMAVFITQGRRVDFGRSCWHFYRYEGFLEQTLMGSFPEREFKCRMRVSNVHSNTYDLFWTCFEEKRYTS